MAQEMPSRQAGSSAVGDGITRHLGDIRFASHHSHAKLLGLFEVSVLHNIVHLLYGVAGVLAARRWATARNYLLAGGAVYLALALYGAVIDKTSGANFVPLNRADDWLHLGLGAGMIGLGALAARKRPADIDLRDRAAR